MKKKTALQQAIQKLKDRRNYYVDESLKEKYTQRGQELLYVKSLALGKMISEFEGLLPHEASQLYDAVCHGWSYDYNTKGIIPLDDYTHKYLLETYGIDYDKMMQEAYDKQDTK